MEDPLIVERGELLKMVEELERLTADLQDGNAGVSPQSVERLRQLRVKVEQARSPSKRKVAWRLALEVLKEVGPELVKLWIETLTCALTAPSAWRWIYAVRGVPEIPARIEWAHAA